MAECTKILRNVSIEKFSEIFGASPRKSRETYFHRHGVRAPKKGIGFSKNGAKNLQRVSGLYDALGKVEDDEMVEEMLRTWLLTKRDLLSSALDHLGIDHDQGLTESDDLNRFAKLSGKELKNLGKVLLAHADQQDIVVYLKFMGAEKVDEALGA